jgi:hypothetical protein
MTLTDSEIEAKAREWCGVWLSHWGTNDQSWIALVRHVLTQAAPAPFPVGTIVVGEGLTEAQTTLLPSGKLIDADATSHAANALEGFHWDCTVEGLEFWRTIRDRLTSMAAALRAGAAPKQPEPMTVADVTVRLSDYLPNGLSISINDEAVLLTKAEARALAAALVAQADAAEAPDAD